MLFLSLCGALCTFMNVLSLLYGFVFQRGKTVPEELVRAEDLGKYRQVASHAVSRQYVFYYALRGC